MCNFHNFELRVGRNNGRHKNLYTYSNILAKLGKVAELSRHMTLKRKVPKWNRFFVENGGFSVTGTDF